MNTNFFNQIQQLDFTGVLQLNVAKGAENKLIVTVLINNNQCGDTAKNRIPPLILNATPQELDQGFFEQITTTRRKGIRLNGRYLNALQLVYKTNLTDNSNMTSYKRVMQYFFGIYCDAIICLLLLWSGHIIAF